MSRWGLLSSCWQWTVLNGELNILQVCKRTGDSTKLMFCKRCDQAYHSHCLQPPLKVSCMPAGTSTGILDDVIERTGKMAISFVYLVHMVREFLGVTSEDPSLRACSET